MTKKEVEEEIKNSKHKIKEENRHLNFLRDELNTILLLEKMESISKKIVYEVIKEYDKNHLKGNFHARN